MAGRNVDKTRGKTAARHLADPREAAILLLRNIELRNKNSPQADDASPAHGADAETPLESATAFTGILRTGLHLVGGRGLVLLQCWVDLRRRSRQCGQELASAWHGENGR